MSFTTRGLLRTGLQLTGLALLGTAAVAASISAKKDISKSIARLSGKGFDFNTKPSLYSSYKPTSYTAKRGDTCSEVIEREANLGGRNLASAVNDFEVYHNGKGMLAGSKYTIRVPEKSMAQSIAEGNSVFTTTYFSN